MLYTTLSLALGLTVQLDDFVLYKIAFNKTYTVEEEPLRRAAFEASKLRVASLSAVEGDDEDVATFGLTKFSDLTPEEFKTQYLNFVRDDALRAAAPFGEAPIPELVAPNDFDWRDHDAVTDVKDQGQCGSCWAFSATEQIESQWILAGNDMVELSPQQVVSCDKVDDGCGGGDTISAFQFVEKNGGLATEESYPYKSGRSGSTGKCQKVAPVAGFLSGYTYATPGCDSGACNKQDETTLRANLASTAPVSICVNAEAWQDYKSGVITNKQCGSHSAMSLDHCVQLVGYSGATENKKGYYMVRNSWNTDWGVDGYIHVQMDKNACGIANEATFVTIKK